MGEVIDLTDVTQICRVCLKRNKPLLPLSATIQFDGHELVAISVLEALVSLTSVSIDLGINLPGQICWVCEGLMKSALLFKFKFEKSSSILKIYTSGILTSHKSFTEQQQLPNVQQSQFNHVQKEKLVDIEKCAEDLRIIEQNHDYSKSPACDPQNESNEEEDQEESETLKSPRKNTTKRKSVLHQCPICMVELEALELRDHVHKHRALKKYLSVPKVSPNAKFYTEPKKTVFCQQQNRLHKCPICNKDIAASEFRDHILNHHRFDSDFSCDKCDRTFSKINHLNIHRLHHLKEHPYECEECNKGFVLKKNYDCHLLMHKDILPHSCEFCDKRFSNPEHLHRHRTVHIENMSYAVKYKAKKCLKCSSSFRDKVLYLNHKCNPVASRSSCKYCHKVFKNPHSMFNHLRSVHMKKHGLCSICGVKSGNIVAHMRLHTSDIKQKSHNLKGLCPVCGSYVANIYNHMARHNKVKTHKCAQCPKAFSTRQELKKHQLIHTGLKPFACGVCNKSFNNHYNLKVHERIHSGNKCHVCKICNKGFLEKSYLRKHMGVHSNLDREKKSQLTNIDVLDKMDIQEELASKLEFYEV